MKLLTIFVRVVAGTLLALAFAGFFAACWLSDGN